MMTFILLLSLFVTPVVIEIEKKDLPRVDRLRIEYMELSDEEVLDYLDNYQYISMYSEYESYCPLNDEDEFVADSYLEEVLNKK